MINKKRSILAMGAHPDDIEFGCGGTLLKSAEQGAEISLYILTDGSKAASAAIRRREQEMAANFLGGADLHWGGFVDAELPDDHALITSMEKVIRAVRPDEVYFHFPGDTHQDHRKLSKAALVASRSITKVFYYDGWSTLDFNPFVFIDIAEVIEKKKRLLACHESQVKRELEYNQNKIEDAIEATARFRGLQAKIRYAEAFLPVRFLRNI
jgi:LmbE family N-acetylglucosaminyl deacetylase